MKRQRKSVSQVRGRSASSAALALLLLLALLIVLCSAPAQAVAVSGWTIQSSGTTNRLLQASCTDSRHCWAVGWNGTIVATVNGGGTWDIQSSGTTASLYGVDFVDALHGWAVGADGTVLFTETGGATWTAQTSGTSLDLLDVSFPDASHGWAVGSDADTEMDCIITTEDGGAHWTTQYSGYSDWAHMSDVCFPDSTHGWVAGSKGLLRATSNGGDTWVSQGPSTNSNYQDVCFLDASHGWVWGRESYTTVSGGVDWTAVSLGELGGTTVLSASFTDASHGWAVAEGLMIATTDGGATWSDQRTGTTQFLSAICFADATHGWAVGANGTVIGTTNGGWAVPNITLFSPASGRAGATVTVTGEDLGAATAVTFGGVAAWDFKVDSNTQVRAVVPSGAGTGRIAVTTPLGTCTSGTDFVRIGGGGTWAPQSSGSTRDLTDASFSDLTHGWVVGAHGTILATWDAGVHWTPQTSGTTNDLQGVSFPGASTGWAVGAAGTVVSTIDGGTTWTPQTSGTSAELASVVFISASQGWALGRDGTIIATGNGGSTWQTQRAAVTEAFPLVYESISFSDADHGCAVGYAVAGQSARLPRLLVTSNGGTTWTAATSDLPGAALRGVLLLNATRGWTVGSGGAVAATADGGATWSAGSSAGGNLYGVSFVDVARGWVAGDYGDTYFRGPGAIHATADGGASWTSQLPGTLAALNDVEFPDATHGWAVGAGGAIVATINGGWSAPTISVAAPTATSSWPSGSVQTVSWNLSEALSTGEFRVSLVSASGTWYVNKPVPVAAGQTACSTGITAAVPAGTYRAAVYWRPVAGSGGWLSTTKGSAFTVTPINITVPGAAAVWPTNATCTVSWNVNPAMSGGEFRVSLLNATSGVWYVNKPVLAVAGKTSYSTVINTLVPAGSYRAAVYWRATVGTGTWTATNKSAVFTIATLAVTSPTGTSTWRRGSTQAVTWTVSPALSLGEFNVWLVPVSGAWSANQQVLAVAGRTDYTASVPVTVVAGSYRAAVYWRPVVGTGTWVLAKKTAWFAVTP